MKVVSGLDPDTLPYPIIDSQPSPLTVVRYLRPSDYAFWFGIAAGFPGGLYYWERKSPSMHPRNIPRLMAVAIPFFTVMGGLLACERSLYRFWGTHENTREVKRFKQEFGELVGDKVPDKWEV